jgi:hypothetical protein
MNFASSRIFEAKAMLAGPFGKETAKFPLRFCKPAYFGPRPAPGNPVATNNGTAALLVRGGEHFAVTCQHVLEGYRAVLINSGPCCFNIGNCEIDPLAQLLVEDHGIDAAIIRLTAKQAAEIVRNSEGIGEWFFNIDHDPPVLAEGSGIAFAGFPGELRRVESRNELSFGGYASGGTPLTTVGANYVVCQFERDEWVKHAIEPEPTRLGGLSGGPAFLIDHSSAGVISYRFAGIIYEFSENWELLYIRQAGAIYELAGW